VHTVLLAHLHLGLGGEDAEDSTEQKIRLTVMRLENATYIRLRQAVAFRFQRNDNSTKLLNASGGERETLCTANI